SHPMCVPVRPSAWRSKCTSSTRGSSSTVLVTPLTVTRIRRVGTSAPAVGSSCTTVISCRLSRGGVQDAVQRPAHERAHHVSLELRTSSVVRLRIGRFRGHVRRFRDRSVGQLVAGEGLFRRGGPRAERAYTVQC